MKHITILITLAILLFPVYNTYAAQTAPVNKTVDIKGKVVKKNIVVKDRAGRKKICNKVFDKRTKKEYLVCN
jgi:hypothetical protein